MRATAVPGAAVSAAGTGLCLNCPTLVGCALWGARDVLGAPEDAAVAVAVAGSELPPTPAPAPAPPDPAAEDACFLPNGRHF